MKILRTVEYVKHGVLVPSDDDSMEEVINKYTSDGWCYCQSISHDKNTVELSFSKDKWQETLIDGKMVYEDLEQD